LQRRPSISTLFPYTTLFRSDLFPARQCRLGRDEPAMLGGPSLDRHSQILRLLRRGGGRGVSAGGSSRGPAREAGARRRSGCRAGSLLPCRPLERRTVSLPAFTVAALCEHRRQQLELRLQLGAGNLPADALVFGTIEGDRPNPYSISDRWRDAVRNRKLPKVAFHALRHSHASALIAAGMDVVAVSRRDRKSVV